MFSSLLSEEWMGSCRVPAWEPEEWVWLK